MGSGREAWGRWEEGCPWALGRVAEAEGSRGFCGDRARPNSLTALRPRRLCRAGYCGQGHPGLRRPSRQMSSRGLERSHPSTHSRPAQSHRGRTVWPPGAGPGPGLSRACGQTPVPRAPPSSRPPLQPYLKSRKAQYRKTRLLSLAASPYCLPVCNETRQLREAAGGAGLGTVRTLAGPQAFAVPCPPWRMLVPQDPPAPSGLCALGPSEAGPAPCCPEPARPRPPPAALSRGLWPHHHHAGARGVLAGRLACRVPV